MILYSYQKNNFNIIKTPTDYNKSVYITDEVFSPMFKRSYEYLFSQLGSNKWIWTYGEFKPECRSKNDTLWILDVPDKHIKCIDNTVWHCVLNNGHYSELYNLIPENLTESEYKKWDKVLDKLHDIYDQMLTKEDTWKWLIKTDRKKWNKTYDEFLIPSPIKRSWVVSKVNMS